MRIIRKLDTPFDVSALETKVENWVAETKQRKARRRAKRIRIGLPVAPEETEEEPVDAEYPGETSSSEAIEEDLVPLETHPRLRTESHRRKKSSSSTTIKSEHEGARISLRQQKHENSVSVRQRRLRRKPGTPDEDSETAEEPTRGRSSTEEPLIEARQIKNSEMAHERNQAPSNRSSYSSKDPKQAQDTGTSNHFSERKKSQRHAKPLSDHEKSLAKSVSSLPKSSGSAGSNLGQVGRGPARLVQARKLALSGAKPRVTGSAILSNWAAKIRTRKALAFRQADIREDIDRSRNFGKLSIKRRYEKAGRHEPAPNPNDLTFVNLKDGKPIKKPTSFLTPIPYKTPFRMFQDGLAKASKPVDANPGDIDVVDVPDDDEDLNMIPRASIDSPQDVEVGEGPMQSGYSHDNEEILSFPSNALQASRRGSAPSVIQIQPIATPTVHTPISPFEVRDFPRRRETEQSPLPARNPLLVERSARAVLAPVHEKALQSFLGGLSVWGERREPSRTDPANELPVGPSERVEIHPEILDTMQRFPLNILRADSGYHQGIPSNKYNSHQHEYNTLENLSDVLGTILIGLEHEEIADVRFRGLNRACKQHFMRIKVPPRQMHVWCKHICTAEDFTRYFHFVGHFLVVEMITVVLTCFRGWVCITELAI